MQKLESLKKRYMKDPLPVRLGGLAADLARLASIAARPANAKAVGSILREACWFIEWSAPEVPLETAQSLVDLQLELSLWSSCWHDASGHPAQRVLLSQEALAWSDRVLGMSGLQAGAA
jgi:hypothetical protein